MRTNLTLMTSLTCALAAVACASDPSPPPSSGNGGSGGRGGAPGARPGSGGQAGSTSPGTGGQGPVAGASGGSSGGSGGTAGVAGGGAGGAAGVSGSGGASSNDAAMPGDASTPAPDPAGAETYVVTTLSPGTGQRTDRRPIPVGFYDATANKTFVSWMGPGSDALVKAYDHASKSWSPDKIAGKSTFSDKHNYPAMIKGRDNRLYVFYGCHNTPLRMAVSPNPLSIDGTWSDGPISAAPEASYPAPIITTEGTMYVFTRFTRERNGHNDDRPLEFIKSSDNGKTWTKQLAIDTYPRSDNLCEIYNGKVSYQPATGGQKARIHLSWTLAGGGPGVHEHDRYTRNVYYAYLDPSNDHLYDVRGRDLGTSIDDAEGEMYCKALDTGCSNCAHQAGYQVSVNYNDDGKPVILFVHSSNGLTAVTWDGAAWTSRVVSAEGGEPRDLVKIGPRSFQAFRTTGNTCIVHRSTDGGVSWRQETVITASHPVGRCHVIENHHPDVKLFLEQNPAAGGGGTSTARVTAGHVGPYSPP